MKILTWLLAIFTVLFLGACSHNDYEPYPTATSTPVVKIFKSDEPFEWPPTPVVPTISASQDYVPVQPTSDVPEVCAYDIQEELWSDGYISIIQSTIQPLSIPCTLTFTRSAQLAGSPNLPTFIGNGTVLLGSHLAQMIRQYTVYTMDEPLSVSIGNLGMYNQDESPENLCHEASATRISQEYGPSGLLWIEEYVIEASGFTNTRCYADISMTIPGALAFGFQSETSLGIRFNYEGIRIYGNMEANTQLILKIAGRDVMK